MSCKLCPLLTLGKQEGTRNHDGLTYCLGAECALFVVGQTDGCCALTALAKSVYHACGRIGVANART